MGANDVNWMAVVVLAVTLFVLPYNTHAARHRNAGFNINHIIISYTGNDASSNYHDGEYYNYLHDGQYYNYRNKGVYYRYFTDCGYFNYFHEGAYYNHCTTVPGHWASGHWYSASLICLDEKNGGRNDKTCKVSASA